VDVATYFVTPLMKRREWLDLAARPEPGPPVVAASAQDDRVLRSDHRGDVGVHCVVPLGEELVGRLATPSRDNNSYTTIFRMLSISG